MGQMRRVRILIKGANTHIFALLSTKRVASLMHVVSSFSS